MAGSIMQHTISTPAQTRALLRALRQARGLSQAQIGERLGVNQKRVARIEAAPHVTSFDQIVRMVMALGGRVLIDDASDVSTVAKTKSTASGRSKRSAAPRKGGSRAQPTW